MVARTIALLAATYALVGACITLCGWLFNRPGLTDWDGDGIAMFANAALCAIVACIALILLLTPATKRRWARTSARVLGSMASLIGGLTLLQHVTGADLGIDRLLVEAMWGGAATSPGRMGPPASTTYLLVGVGIILASMPRSETARRSAALIAMLAIIPPIIAWMAYFYGADPLYSVPHITGIARQTATMLVCICFALIVAVPNHGLGGLLHRDDAGGTIARHLLPISIVLLLVTGWLEHNGERHGWYDAAFGNAALTVVRILMFTALLWWTARVVSHQVLRRRKVESALTEAQQRFSVMVNSIQQLAWMARPDGWVYWFNDRWYQYTGTKPEQVEGWGWQAVLQEQELPEVLRQWNTSINTGSAFDMVVPLRGADGTYRHFLTRVSAVKDDAGQVLHWFGTHTDVSEQTAAQDALRETNRMKDEFLATLSHELRTPMSAILGWAQMLRSSAAAQSKESNIGQGLEVIERNARLQSQIIEDLLDMNRILSGKVRLDVQSIDLASVVMAAVDSIRPAAEARKLRVQAVCDPLINSVRGDPNRLQQVVYNLLTNAVKFTPVGGKIQVHCARVNSHVEISVSDTGVGIKSEFLPFVFERFRQQDASTTRTFGGLGLGLGIVKHLVELHGGSVHVASEGVGKGATFTVHLPVSIAVLPGPDVLPDADSRQHPSAAGWREGEENAANESDQVAGITALVVDDEPDAREMLRHLLERHGAKAMTASSAPDAIAILAENQPDILVCDIGMPGMDGYDLIKAVRQLPASEGGKTPAIALTAFARAEDRVRSLRAGFQMHLSKPVETAELLASIANLARSTEATK